jgi:hypothetical protein
MRSQHALCRSSDGPGRIAVAALPGGHTGNSACASEASRIAVMAQKRSCIAFG